MLTLEFLIVSPVSPNIFYTIYFIVIKLILRLPAHCYLKYISKLDLENSNLSISLFKINMKICFGVKNNLMPHAHYHIHRIFEAQSRYCTPNICCIVCRVLL